MYSKTFNQKRRKQRKEKCKQRCNNNKCFIHLKMLAQENEVICFSNQNEMSVENALIQIKELYQLNSISNLYLVEEQYQSEIKRQNDLVHGKTYVCKRREGRNRYKEYV